MVREQRASVYAGFSYSVDTTDQQAIAMAGKARSMQSQLAAAAAFINPELLAIREERLMQWIETESRLTIYKHFFSNLFRVKDTSAPAKSKRYWGCWPIHLAVRQRHPAC